VRRKNLRTGAVIVGLLIAVSGLLWTGRLFAALPRLGADCGGGASIVGSDLAGKVSLGSGAGDTCTLTFAEELPNAPACAAMNETNAGAAPGPVGTATTTTTLVLDGGGSKSAPLSGGDTVSYLCVGY
jgi:hypothetical protein